MAIEKLNLEDFFVMELAVDKINQIIDALNDIDDRLSQRIDSNWKHHKLIVRQLDELKEKLGQKKEQPNGNSTEQRKD